MPVVSPTPVTWIRLPTVVGPESDVGDHDVLASLKTACATPSVIRLLDISLSS
jgi:hypothetical protein